MQLPTFCSFLLLPGYVTPVPDEYKDLPQLQGRATVEMIFKKPDGESFDIEGTLYKEAKMKMIIDGYTGKHLISVIYSSSLTSHLV